MNIISLIVVLVVVGLLLWLVNNYIPMETRIKCSATITLSGRRQLS